MTKDEIKKALECCEKYAYCKDCPCHTYCEHELHKGALDLITEQEKEIEQLKAEQEKRLTCDFVRTAQKQAKIDILNKLKEKAISLSAIETYHICNLVDEMIEELEK